MTELTVTSSLLACASHCQSCSQEGKCDSGKCDQGYVLASDSTCISKSDSLILTRGYLTDLFTKCCCAVGVCNDIGHMTQAEQSRSNMRKQNYIFKVQL